MSLLNTKELPQLAEPCKTPVAFLGDKAMVRIYEQSMRSSYAAGRCKDLRLTVKIVGSWILEITRANWAHACHPSGAFLGSA
jgi:hypothetical protein